MTLSRNLAVLARLAETAKRAHRAQHASQMAADVRAALEPGSSRAKVTSANARWASTAEDRDRAFAELEAAILETTGGTR